MLAFAEFAEVFKREFTLEDEQVQESTELFDALVLDSLDVLRLLLLVEELAGYDYSFEFDPPPMYTIGDVFEHYVSLCTRAASDSTA